MSRQAGESTSKTPSQEELTFHWDWFLVIIFLGLLLPGLAEGGCFLDRSLRAQRVLDFGVMYTASPLISNNLPFIAYACLAPWLFHVRFRRPFLARRLLVSGLLGMSIVVFAISWILVNDYHEVGQGFLFYAIVFPMFIVGGLGALIGMVGGLIYDRYRR